VDLSKEFVVARKAVNAYTYLTSPYLNDDEEEEPGAAGGGQPAA